MRRVAEASCLARELAAAAAAGKATNSVDTSECGHHFYPASSSVVRSAKPVANVVKSSRRQCMRAAGDERFGEAPVGEELIGTLACECGDRMDL